jgi:hypothetical protein
MNDQPAPAPRDGVPLPEGMRSCARCGRPFAPLRPLAKYCTSFCRHRAHDERARERAKEQRS